MGWWSVRCSHLKSLKSRFFLSIQSSGQKQCLQPVELVRPLRSSSNLASMEDLVGQFSADLAGFSEDLANLEVEALSFFTVFFFFSASSLKPGDYTVPWPSTTPTTDTSTGSTRVGQSVCRNFNRSGSFLCFLFLLLNLV